MHVEPLTNPQLDHQDHTNMKNLNEKPKSSIEMLIEVWTSPTTDNKVVINEEAVGDGEVTMGPSAVSSRAADVVGMLSSITAAHNEIRKAGKEINQLPTDVSQRLFARYQTADRALLQLEKELQHLMQ